MGEVVNLNQFRKKQKKEDKIRRSAQNRARSSQTRKVRLAATVEAEHRESELDGKRVETSPPDEPTTS